FQAEDGIRDSSVTGVQTCALPIYRGARIFHRIHRLAQVKTHRLFDLKDLGRAAEYNGRPKNGQAVNSRPPRTVNSVGFAGRRRRSEERRVGKECRSRACEEREVTA